MKIGFDAKRAVSNNTGLGNYSRLVIDVRTEFYPDEEYRLYTPKIKENSRLTELLARRGVTLVPPATACGRAMPALWRVGSGIVNDFMRDKIDLFHGLSNELPLSHIEVPSVEYEAMRRREQPESSAVIRERVNAAREVQKRRFGGTSVSCNAYMTPAMIGQFCQLDEAGEKLMQGAFDRLGLTGRSHDRILRMARTIADLDGAERIQVQHLAEAIQYRSSNLLK